MMRFLFLPLPVAACAFLATSTHAQVTTPGFLNLPRPEAPGSLLSHPAANDSANIGRTTTINYVNGWLIVGAESPGSLPGSDLTTRVYDISDPAAPLRRFPSDFNLNYPNNLWFVGNSGWNAHGSAQSGPDLLPIVLRVPSFGAPVELGGTNGIPNLTAMALGYNRSSQAGPWDATLLWYLTPDTDMRIRRVSLSAGGVASFQNLATFDHVGPFGGGDWHPMFFGDLLVYARSGGAAHDGVVVYRLQYNDFDDPVNRSITPHYVGSLAGGFDGYWPTLFSDGSGLYVIGSATDILTAADISRAADPADDGTVSLAATLTVPGFSNASYPVFQDQFGFIHNRKVNMSDFLGGDANPIDLTLVEDAPHGVDTSQMSLPLGNLWLTGGYPGNGRSQGLAVWVHQSAPDTTAPRVSFHIPQAGRTHYPRHAPLSFLLHEHPGRGGPRNGVDFTVRPVLPGDTLGSAVDGYLIHDFSGVLTFTPNPGLDADSTYQVDFLSDAGNGIGFSDPAGNFIEAYTFRFSTGSVIDATPPPVFGALTADQYQPAPGAVVTVTATATGDAPLDYRFNFDGNWSPWGSTANASHTYTTAGRPRVLAQVRDSHGNLVTRSLALLVLDPPPGPLPTQSSSLAIGDDPAGRRLWCVNPDADTVAVLDPVTGEKLAEHPVGANPRSLARDAFGRYWISCHGSDEIRVLNPDGSGHATLSLPYGSAPFGVAASPDGSQLFVSLYGSARLHRYSAATPNSAPVVRATFPTPRALAVSADGQRLFVTRFLSPDLEAEIGEFAAASAQLDHVRTFRLSSANPTDGGDRASGVPNYLAAIALSPDGTRAAIASKQDNIQRGPFFGVADLTHESTVRAVVSFLDLAANHEIRDSRRDFDNSDSPSALAYTPRGDTLLVALQGNNRVVGLDALSLAPVTGFNVNGSTETSPAVHTLDTGTGLAPQGLLLDGPAGRLFTQDFMGRSVTVRDAVPLLVENRTTLPLVATTGTVEAELLAPEVLLGKRIFYNAADSRMSAEGYLSCASCHLDGGHDGRVWDFTGRGEGLRRTTDLRGRAGTGHGNVHWSANFDEIQDFEHDIRGPFGGDGFLPLDAVQFAAQHPSPGTAKAGLSPELDALAAYVASLGNASVPRSPGRNPDGSLTAAALRGRDVFAAANCAACHSGTAFTESADGSNLRDVGTLSALSGQRLGQTLAGIDTPTLRGLHAARGFLHHGQAAGLADVFSYTGGTFLPAAGAQLLTTVDPGAVTVISDNPAQGGGGFVRGMFGGAFVEVHEEAGAATPPGVAFGNIDGGAAGGPARITLRHLRLGNPRVVVRINGVAQNVDFLPQSPVNDWQTSGWRTLTVDASLLPGPNNTIEVLRSEQAFANFRLNALLVSNADNVAAAAPHRSVLSLSAADQADLLAYLAQLDGSADPVLPFATLTPVPGFTPPLVDPFLDFDIVFSAPVTGLEAGDFLLGGSAGATLAHLSTVTAGTHYRLRVTGFNGPGDLAVQLPAGSVTGIGSGPPNAASSSTALTYSPPLPDALAPFSDEFDSAATLSQWQRNEFVEGWNVSKLEEWDIDTSAAGHMRLTPYSGSWYQDFTGAYAYKEISGDFVLTTRLDVARRNGQPGRPTSDYSLAGLMIRSSRGVTHAAPQPDPGPATVLPWPPPVQGQPGHFSSDWQPGTENYIFLSFGFGADAINNNPNQWQYEVKTTLNGVSTLYPRFHGVPVGEGNATLQIVRRGATFLLLRRHGVGPWIIENRFERPDFPATLQLGITTYTDWNLVSAGWNFVSPVEPYHQNRVSNAGLGNPDLVADVDFFRLRRPDPSLTAGDLQALAFTGPEGPVRPLAGTAVAGLLGDSAAVPLPTGATYGQWLGQHLTPAQLADPALTDPLADLDGDSLPSLVDFLTDGDLLGGDSALHPGLTSGDTPPRYRVGRNPAARGWRVLVETSLDLGAWQTVATSDHGAPFTGPGVLGTDPAQPLVTLIGPGGDEGVRSFFRTRAVPAP